jgi:tetratricopeptide (TPR) repeat protein
MKTRRMKMILALVLGAAVSATAEGIAPSAAAPVEEAIAAAEGSLAKGELKAAEGHYREALFAGWLLMAQLERADGRSAQARQALGKAAPLAGDDRARVQTLAWAYVDGGQPADAAEVLTALCAKDARDVESRRLLAKALAAAGRSEQALARLDEARVAAGDDPELAFALGTEYLWLKKPDVAQALFAHVLVARPIPQTHVLVGRAYRDAGAYDRARAELHAALALEPSIRRAHYYLGMIALADAGGGADRLDRAIAEFHKELELDPADPATNDQLGTALLEGERPAEALPALEAALKGEARSGYLYHLGRCQFALNRTNDAATSLRRALEMAEEQGGDDSERQKIHYQLGVVLRKLGDATESAAHLAEARRLAAAAAEHGPGAPAAERSADETRRPSAPRGAPAVELRRRVVAALARSYLNLGVIQAQSAVPAQESERFARAATFFESAAELDPDFPKVQSSLGVAYFNARQFDKAIAPLERASAAEPKDAGLHRMLAMALVSTESWDKAARLLRADPERAANPSLQFTYALALVRAGQGAEAEPVLTGLLDRQGNLAGLRVLLAQACSLQGKQREAVAHLQEAARLSPDDPAVRKQLAEATRALDREGKP